jgi:hypothetical protein
LRFFDPLDRDDGQSSVPQGLLDFFPTRDVPQQIVRQSPVNRRPLDNHETIHIRRIRRIRGQRQIRKLGT